MALPPPCVSSPPDLNVNNVPNETPKTQRDLLGNMPMAMNTALTRPAIDAGSYPQTALLIAGFLKGMPMRVTYYAQQRQGSANDRTAITDYPAERDVLTTEYWKILNFELKLREGVQFTFDSSKPEADLSWQAMVEPGQQPLTGDKMLYEMGPGQLVILVVNDVENTSPYQDTAYLISFAVQSYCDNSDIDALNGATTKQLVWTRRSMGGTPYSVLTSESYLLLQYITAFRSELINYYFEVFYSEQLNSFLRPDGVYDPAAVRFLVNKISIDDTGRRCAVLYRDIDKLYYQSVWGRLDRRYVSNMQHMSTGYILTTAQFDGFSSFFNELYNTPVIVPRPYTPNSPNGKPRVSAVDQDGYLYWTDYTPAIIGPTGWIDYTAVAIKAAQSQGDIPPSYYAFSQAFWTNDPTTMSQTEKYLREMIFTRSLTETDPLVFRAYFDSIWMMDDITQYYTIPIMVHMIDMLKRLIPETVNARNF